MNDRNKTVDVNRRVAAFIEDESDDLPHYRNLGNDTREVVIRDSLDTLQELCEDLNIGEDHLAHCIALSHYADLEETA